MKRLNGKQLSEQGEAANDDEAESRERKARANLCEKRSFRSQADRSGRLWIGLTFLHMPVCWRSGTISFVEVKQCRLLVAGGMSSFGPDALRGVAIVGTDRCRVTAQERYDIYALR